MDLIESLELMEKYSRCPKCGSDRVGGGSGSIQVDDDTFTRTCVCGWSVTVNKKIKVIATATKKQRNRVIEGIVEIRIGDDAEHKYVSWFDLKCASRVTRINHTKKIEEWLNTSTGRKWVEEADHIISFAQVVNGHE